MKIIYSEHCYNSDKRKFEKAYIIVTKGFIADVLPEKPQQLLNMGYDYIDLSGKYVVPGLINTHVHFEFSCGVDAYSDFIADTPEKRMMRSLKNAEKMLLSGVTTVRDAGSSWQAIALKNPELSTFARLPRILFCGTPLTITGGHLHFMGYEADSAAELLKGVRFLKKQGVDAIKIMADGGQMTPGSLPEKSTYTTEMLKVICDEARFWNRPTLAHVLTAKGFEHCMNGGVDSLEHCAFFEREEHGWLKRVFPQDESLFDAAKERCVFAAMGLSASIRGLDRAKENPQEATAKEVFLMEQERHMLEIFTRLLVRGLVPVVMNDAGTAFSAFDETWLELVMMKKAGMSEADIIHAATVHSADCLNLGNKIGRIKKGFAADIIALNGNPLDNIEQYRNVSFVHASGEAL